jgi:predicted ATPase
VGIQKPQVKGFRSLKDVAWEPGRLNVLIGPSCVLFTLLQHGARGDLPQEILRQGGITPLLWDGQVRGVSWNLVAEPSRTHEVGYRAVGIRA